MRLPTSTKIGKARLFSPPSVGKIIYTSPKDDATKCPQAKPENATAFKPCPGKVLSPTQYKSGIEVRLKGIPNSPKGLPVGIGP
jgi:hypothetical protein